MDENACPVQGKDFTSPHPTYYNRNASQVQHTSKSSPDQLRPLQSILCLCLVILFLGTQKILSHFIYPSNYRQHYSYSSRTLPTAHIFPLPQHPFPFLFAQNYWHMSWLLTAFCAWQHSHPFISSRLGHLPIFLPFQIPHTQNETNTSKTPSLICP